MKSFFKLSVVFITFISWMMSSCATGGDVIKAPVESSPPTLSADKSETTLIQKLIFTEEEKFTRIHIEGTTSLPPPLYKLVQEPLRIVVDLPLVDLHQVKHSLKVDNGTISEIYPTQYDDKGRIEIGLLQMTHYNIFREDKSIFIDIEKVKKSEQAHLPIQEEKVEKEEKVAQMENTSPESNQEEPSSLSSPSNGSSPLVEGPSPLRKVQKAKEILDVSLEEKQDYIAFNIIADGTVENYNLFKLDAPPRLVLDIWEVGTQYPKKSVRLPNPFVKEVRIGHHQGRLRLVFDSLKPHLPTYQINRVDDRLVVLLGNVPQTSNPQMVIQDRGMEKQYVPKLQFVSTTPSPVVAQGTPAPSETSAKATRPKIALKEIDFKQIDEKSRIMMTLSGEPLFETYRIAEKAIAIDIKNAFAPKHLQRGMNTSEFDSAIQSIDVKNVKNDLRILVKLREDKPYETTKEGNLLFFDIAKPEKIVKKFEPAPPPPPSSPKETPAPPKEEMKTEVTKAEEKPPVEPQREEPQPPIKPTETSAPQPKVAKTIEEGDLERLYTGRKISLDFKDADIKNILRLIAEVSNFNIITADDVSGKITMRLVDVPWDQALDVILQSRNLGKVQVGNVMRIAPIETLRRESQARLEEKRAKERLEDTVTELIPVNYATAKDIIPQIKGVLSERGDVKVDDRTNLLIIKDIPRSIPAVKNLVKSLDTKTPQVAIEARIVEANLTFQRELGVKWGFEIGGGKATAGGGTSGTVLGSGTREVVDLPAIARAGIAGATGAPGIIEFLFSRGTIQSLDLAISAHENKGDVKIISSPKIATLHNKEASIEQGLRIPYRKLTTEGTISTDFIDANLKLTVTPLVTNDGHVKLTIKAKKDAPDTSISVDGVPSIDKKEAITEVLVKDNGVVVIAGVYSIEKSDGTEGIPLFSKIPLLGWLFKREAKEDKRKDLLIFISPRIIKDQV